MAGAEYEVNIKLNAKQVDDQLKKLETSLNKLGKSSANITDQRTAAMVKLRDAGDQVRALEQKGINVAKARFQIDKGAQALDKGRLLTTNQRATIATRIIRDKQRELALERQITKEDQTQLKLAQKASTGSRRRMRGQGGGRLGDVALGAGFPLLFGGGPGSVLGGAAGGALGGGLAGQIALSALGQQLDKFGADAIKTGQALNSVSGALGLARDKSLFSTEAIEKRAAELEEQGKIEELSTLITKEFVQKIGNDGVKALQEVGAETDKTTRLWGDLSLQLQVLIAGPLKDFLVLINSTLGAVTTSGRFKVLESELTGKALASFQSDVAARKKANLAATSSGVSGASGMMSSMGTRGGVGSLSTADMKEFVNKYSSSIEVTTKIPDLGGFDDPKPDNQAKKAARRLKASQERIRLLEIEAAKIKDITQFKNRIAQAELDGDKQLIVRIKLEQKIVEINAKKNVAMEKLVGRDLPLEQQLREQIAITAGMEAREAEAKAEAVRKLTVIQKEEDQRHMDAIKKHIEEQYKLNTAVQQQLALADGISNIMGQGMTQAFDSLLDGADNWGNALQEIASNVLRDIAKQLIQIYIIEQAIGFMKTLMTPFDVSTPLGAGGGQVGKFGTFGPNYGIAQRAKGGPVSGNQPYLVGERGPELFVPGAQGNIVPNHAMGGGANVTVNVDASGSKVQGNQADGKALGSAIGAAVQAELIKQKRPGGLLAG